MPTFSQYQGEKRELNYLGIRMNNEHQKDISDDFQSVH